MRVNSPRRRRHKKILKLAKGFFLSRSKRFKVARQAVLRAGQHAYIGRKLRKRDKRREWIIQINSALTQLAMEQGTDKVSYSKLINGLKTKEINLDRKTLAHLSKEDLTTFKHVVEKAMS